jgi:integrase
LGAETFRAYALRWLAERELKPRTRAEYDRMLTHHLIPAFGTLPLKDISPAGVRSWYATNNVATPTQRARVYGLLKSIMKTAVEDDAISASPCRIRKAGQSKRRIDPKPATLAELEIIRESMPERLRLIVQLAAWCALRYGELIELRRDDFDLVHRVVRIDRAAVRVRGEWLRGDPKSDAGRRSVSMPPHVVPYVEAHLDAFVPRRGDARLFPGALGGYLSPSSLYDHFYPAREAAGRPDLRFHDLRHTGATLTASTGASLAELMKRLGHSTPVAAMRYQHATEDRDAAIAEALSGFALAQTVALRPRGTA